MESLSERLTFLSCSIDSCETTHDIYTATGIESWNSKSVKHLKKSHLAPCLRQGQLYLCHSWLMFIEPVNKGVPRWQLQFSPAIHSVAFNIFIIKMFFIISNPGSFVLESNLINFLFYSSWTWWAIFFPFLQKLFPYQKVCKYILRTGDKISSIYLAVIGQSW